MERSFDLAVVGSGSAGTQAALGARKHGRSVAVIDERPFGGTCALRGCDPKKVLVHAARVLEQTRRLRDRGILGSVPVLRWPELIAFKRTFTDPVPQQRVRTLEDAGVAVIHGRASFAGSRTLLVGEESIRADRILIASGAQEVHVARGDGALLTSETFMELAELPESLIFVGGGFVGFEFAHVAARAGARVTILHNDAHPLAGFDADLVGRLIELSRAAGITIHLNTPAESVEAEAGGIAVRARSEQAERIFRARAGVLSAGRAPNLDSLDLERGNVERTKKGVKVNEHMQSVSNPSVYAAGDAADAGALPLTPVAGYTGEIAAHNIVNGNERTADFTGLASVVYTIPPLASAGLSERAAREKGLKFDVHAGDMSDWYSTRHIAAPGAYYKLLVERDGAKIIGASVLGPHAEEQINVLALAIRAGVHSGKLSDTLFAYPTGSSDLEYMIGS